MSEGFGKDDFRSSHHNVESERAARDNDVPGGNDLPFASGVGAWSPRLLRGSISGGHGSAPVRAATMLQAQRTHGNRAVQRYVQRSTSAPSHTVSVQRNILGDIGSGLSSAWDWVKGTASKAWDWVAGTDKVTGDKDTAKLEDPTQKAFNDFSKGGFNAKDAPEKVTVPKQMVEGMQKAWEGSFPGGKSQEQGGIMVKNAKGEYEWRAGKPGTSGEFMPNRGDVKSGETLVASGHTHPYDESEGGDTDVAFSGGDLANMINNPEEFKMVQSGKGQFMAARTKEFDEKVKSLDKEGKDKMYKEMKDEYDKVFKSTEGNLSEKSQAAAKAVSDKYNLAYYSGQGGELSRQ